LTLIGKINSNKHFKIIKPKFNHMKGQKYYLRSKLEEEMQEISKL